MVRSWMATSLFALLVVGCDLPVDGLGDPSQLDPVDAGSGPVKDASSATHDARHPDADTVDSGVFADGGDEAGDPGGDQSGGQGDQGERGRGH